MDGFAKFAYVETKLFLREKVALIAVFGLPIALVIGFGMIPGFDKPQKGLSDQIGTEFIASVGVAIVLATLGLNGVPMVISQYRERGILRRLGVTPVRPATLLIAKLAVWAASAVASVIFLVAVARFGFHVPLPRELAWFLVSFLLAIAALFALGMLAAAVAPTSRAAIGIGWVLFFPSMLLGGIYFPTEEMSAEMRRVGEFTPLGSALHAVRDTWMGLHPSPLYLGIMAGYVIVGGVLAARFFRWDTSAAA